MSSTSKIPNIMSNNALISIVTRLQEAQESLRAVHGDDKQQSQKEGLIDLPQIAVVGMQSAGKSSVLESIVGFDFLPRGMGTVTRRPIVVQLKQSETTKATLRDSMNPEKKEQQFEGDGLGFALMKALEAANKAVGARVSNIKIFVEIHDPKYVNLTLVDLPGLIANAPDDHPEMKQEIVDMVRSEIHDNTMILLIHAANGDPSNDMGMNLAKEVDPEGERTIGVLTKVDEIHTVAERQEVFANFFSSHPKTPAKALKWIPVRNRSADEATTDVSGRRADEVKFFNNDPIFETVGEEVGADFLVKALVAELVDRIRRSNIILDLKTTQKQVSEELESLKQESDSATFKKEARGKILKFVTDYESKLDGSSLEGEGLSVGAEIVRVYKGDFLKRMKEVDPLAKCRGDPQYVMHTIENARGAQDDFTAPFTALRRFVKDAIEKEVGAICGACLKDVNEVLKWHVQKATSGLALEEWVAEKASDVIKLWMEECDEFVQSLVSMEAHYVNRQHPDFPHYPATIPSEKQNSSAKGPSSGAEALNSDDVDPDIHQNIPLLLGVGAPGGEDIVRVKTARSYRDQSGKIFLSFYGSDKIDLQEISVDTEGKSMAWREKWVSDFTDHGSSRQETEEWVSVFSHEGTVYFCPVEKQRETLEFITKQKLNGTLSRGEQKARTEQPKTEETSSENTRLVNFYESYLGNIFDIARIKIIDSIPKAINLFVVKRITNDHGVLERVLDEWDECLADESKVESIMGWTEEGEARKKALMDAEESMEAALEAFEEADVSFRVSQQHHRKGSSSSFAEEKKEE